MEKLYLFNEYTLCKFLCVITWDPLSLETYYFFALKAMLCCQIKNVVCD